MLLAIDPTECECGTEMRLVETGTEKSVPLVGSTIAFRRYECPECGATGRYELDVNGGEWVAA
jgi:hypothetical protein